MTFGSSVKQFPTPIRKVKYRYLAAKPRLGSGKCSAYSTRYFPLFKQRDTPPAHFLQKDKRLCSSRSLFLFRAALTKSLTSYFAHAVINRASFLNNDPRRPFGQKWRVFSTCHQTPDSSSKPRHARNLSLARASTDGREQAGSIRSARTCGKGGTRRSSTARGSSETCTPQASRNANRNSHR